MTRIRQRMFLIPVTMLAVVALMGTSLGVLTAQAVRTGDDLAVGVNLRAGLVQSGTALTPGQWTSCLPASAWKAIYTFDNQTKLWSHYFNPVVTNVPDYVNLIGGIEEIRFSTPVVIVAVQAVDGPQYPETAAQAAARCE